MNKKLLICGSAIAVVVLVLASFSPVVGYNSINSSVYSPLFNVRAKRAINEESGTLTCNYLRKGQLMSFPTRNSKTVQIQNMIDIIKNMDDRAFDRFIEQIAHRYRTQKLDVSLETIIAGLTQIRKNVDNHVWEPTSGLLCLWFPTQGVVCIWIFIIFEIFVTILFGLWAWSKTLRNECDSWAWTCPGS